ncbi:bifunctional glycosyltransferase family 2/GtrA family protein [Tessaracoccus palaemonis]|uniref:Bifunctional glycosyltransferase family 2/GtrA family protein n=1 Tax=Tessaracoccus palaemonis TaxID=2829499 RepID=A0ABX8SNN3_9ACTN|nr:bifunctional glycosyltransferase family 2/GtrA family protein [Tessaracoccus palaemonis]QXT63673.1 bifunctional glycosyltransferase family 2/GtrA family protein [Tessaracoccus palaemonis]
MFAVLIPAYEPDLRLVALVTQLDAALPDVPVVIVDDGSGPDYCDVFAAAAASGAVILTHEHNRGKGAALRTGFADIVTRLPGFGVVTADCDGQHTPTDIARVAARLDTLPPGQRCVVLGCREFTGAVPARSRFGNSVTRALFRSVTRQDVPDTQTGLRAFPAITLPWALGIQGDRFDYEFRMLLLARQSGISLVTMPIETVYTDGNASSHFRPLVDSLRIYAPLARFAGSSLLAFAVDTGVLLLLNWFTGRLLLAVVGARLVSAGVNFAVNRRLVFRRGREVPLRSATLRYLSLAALLLAANYGVLTALTDAGTPLLLAKVATEAALFLASYSIQRTVVFDPLSGSHNSRGQMLARTASQPV